MDGEQVGPRIEVRVPADWQSARDFLKRLSEDDAFREQIEQGNLQGLVEYGIEIEFPEGLAPETLRLKLPPKWQIEDLLSRTDTFGDKPTAPLGHSIYVVVLPYAGATGDEEQGDGGG